MPISTHKKNQKRNPKKRVASGKVALTVVDVPHEEPEKKKFDGFIKHPWYAVVGAAILGAIIGFFFFWRKKKNYK